MHLRFQIFVFFLIASLSACEFKTPPEMMVGKWYIASVKANTHDVLEDYLDANTRYLIFEEEGVYRLGLLDSASDKNWILDSKKNKLSLKQGSPFNDIKTWEVRAADEVIYLTDQDNHFHIVLNRVTELPEPMIKEEVSLIGRWVVNKVTINGHNNTDTYAFPQRWILLTENGRFYNGSTDGNQKVGYWKANPSLTKLDFFDDSDDDSPFISFNIANNSIWYEKQQESNNRPKVRIYFEKDSL